MATAAIPSAKPSAAPIRIALDAFGGDTCPRPEVEGAVEAARRGVNVVLVGDEPRLHGALASFDDWKSLPIELYHAPDIITMEDSPSKAVRAKPTASMPVCFDLVKSGRVDAVMSAGNSGAMLACGLFKFRRIRGVERPALVTSLPTRKDFVTFLDVGANIDVRPLHLVQFAVLGAVYAGWKHGRVRPRVAVLSNGSEDSKGTELTRSVHRLLSEHESDDFFYAGYAEGGDLFGGDLDVVVTDGFTGNIALKFTEATGRLIGHWMRTRIGAAGLRGKLGGLLLRPAFGELRAMLNPDTYGAAPLLGVNGVAFICHGGSSPLAISTSLKLAARSVTEDLTPRLADAIGRHRDLFEAARAETEAAPRG